MAEQHGFANFIPQSRPETQKRRHRLLQFVNTGKHGLVGIVACRLQGSDLFRIVDRMDHSSTRLSQGDARQATRDWNTSKKQSNCFLKNRCASIVSSSSQLYQARFNCIKLGSIVSSSPQSYQARFNCIRLGSIVTSPVQLYQAGFNCIKLGSIVSTSAQL